MLEWTTSRRSRRLVRSTGLPLIVLWIGVSIACGGKPEPPPLTAQVTGTVEIAGLSAPVRIVRDRWGVPHIYAESTADLFTAQGFVQAEDRLFQMDLWRRAAQGRLSQVLGSNFMERDVMTRRVQYRGSLDAEWASYGSDTRAIASAFVRGINAWVAVARTRRPEPFVLAGWGPEYWIPTDVLNRTDAFLQSSGALEDVRRANLSDVVGNAIRRVGTAPFFVSLAAPVTQAVRLKPDTTDARQADTTGARQPDTTDTGPANATGALATSDSVPLQPDLARGYVTAARGAPLLVSEARGAFENPSTRYLVHLHAPGWNVIGVTRPWLPGVAIGHNERVAWGMAPFAADTEDVYVEPLRAADRVAVEDAVVVKGRAKPFTFVSEFGPHGVIVALDSPSERAFSLRWSGTETGAAPELGGLALDRAANWEEFRAALERWKMPARQVVFADVEGNVGLQTAALVPVRQGREWRGWMSPDDLPHVFNPAGGGVEAKSGSAPQPHARQVVFSHVLGITDAARRRFDIGPLAAAPGDAPTVRGVFDPANWDRSRAMAAPGQSGSPDSRHFDDLARLWSQGLDVPLAFSDAQVAAATESTLTLVPRR